MPSRLIAYGTSPKYADTVFTLMPHAGWVNLGIYRALELADPHGLLQGTGKLHRHVKLNHLKDVESPDLNELLAGGGEKKAGIRLMLAGFLSARFAPDIQPVADGAGELEYHSRLAEDLARLTGGNPGW